MVGESPLIDRRRLIPLVLEEGFDRLPQDRCTYIACMMGVNGVTQCGQNCLASNTALLLFLQTDAHAGLLRLIHL